MTKKNGIIVTLLALAVTLLCVIELAVIPAVRDGQAQYVRDQADSLTHDITSAGKYKSPYLGDASNTANLFYSLPLNQVPMTFQIDPDRCSLTVCYEDAIRGMGEEKVRRDLAYNSIVAMASIDNLSAITYEWSGDTVTFRREQLEAVLGSPLSGLLEPALWAERVQHPMRSAGFVDLFYPAAERAEQ